MKHAKTFLGLTSASILSLVVLATTDLGTAIAQGPFDDVMAFIINDEENPVPVVRAGRQRYQTSFSVFTETSEDCSPVEIPDGMTLTIKSVGVDVNTDGPDLPSTYIRVGRIRPGGFSLFRYSGELHAQGGGNYVGLFKPDVFAGPSEEGVEWQVAICIGGVTGGATFNDARGVVSGFLEPGGVFDGVALQ